MNQRNKKNIITIFLLFVIACNSFSQSENNLEERVSTLEDEVENLKEMLLEFGLTDETNGSEIEINNEIVNDSLTVSPITVELLSLKYNESNNSNDYANDYRDWISFTFLFTNNLKKSIRATKGAVIFMDVFGEEWWSIGLTLTDPIKAGEQIRWIGQIDYNGFIDSHKTAKQTDPENVIVRYDVTQILFEDGTQASY